MKRGSLKTSKNNAKMDCIEAQRCIHLFLKDEFGGQEREFVEHVCSCGECMEELTIEYLLFEGIEKLENSDKIDLQKEIEGMLSGLLLRVRRLQQLKAGLFLLMSIIVCMMFLGGA